MRLLYNATNSSQWPLYLCTKFYNMFFVIYECLTTKGEAWPKSQMEVSVLPSFSDEEVNGCKFITPIIKNSELPAVLVCM